MQTEIISNYTARQWPLMMADLGCSMETIMAHSMSDHIAEAHVTIFGELIAQSQEMGFKVRVIAGGT